MPAPELYQIGSPCSSRAGSAISSAGSSWELVGAASESPLGSLAGQAPSLPEGGGRTLATARCSGPVLVLLWTLLTIVRDPPAEDPESEDEERESKGENPGVECEMNGYYALLPEELGAPPDL